MGSGATFSLPFLARKQFSALSAANQEHRLFAASQVAIILFTMAVARIQDGDLVKMARCSFAAATGKKNSILRGEFQ
jgi:hypothetical protein